MRAYVWQMQARGVLHVHVLCAWDSELDRIASRCYIDEVRRLAPEYGFGYVDFRDRAGKAGKASVLEAARAAGYVSRYLSSAESVQFVQAVKAGERPRRLVYVSPRLTRQTGCTMRNLRRVRFLWWIRQGGSSALAAAGSLPRWFSVPDELSVVLGLAAAPGAP